MLLEPFTYHVHNYGRNITHVMSCNLLNNGRARMNFHNIPLYFPYKGNSPIFSYTFLFSCQKYYWYSSINPLTSGAYTWFDTYKSIFKTKQYFEKYLN